MTNRVYVANDGSDNVTVITPAPTSAIPLNTAITPVPNHTVNTATPTFTLTATSTYSPNAPPPQNIYFQTDTLIKPFLFAAEQSRTATTLTANATTPSLRPGIHILYFFAGDGSEATSINPARSGEENFHEAPASSPVIGGINAYLFLVPLPPEVTSVSSRKLHGAAGEFDINLPLNPPFGVECRTGGAGNNHRVLVTFANPVTLDGVSVTSTNGLATAGQSASGAVVKVELAAVANAQILGITLINVRDGTSAGDVLVPFRVLIGDTTQNSSVTASDIGQVKAQSGQPVDLSSFRLDVSANGAINSTDIGLVKANSGTQLP